VRPKRHTHRTKTVKEYGFSHCENPFHCIPESHGSILRIETCSCGATKRVNQNQGWREQGPWVVEGEVEE
jgi:hypothetical protein